MQKGRRMLKGALKLGRDALRYLAFRPSDFRGVYENFTQAEAAAPKRKKVGYNHKDLADEYKTKSNFRLSSSDYPVLFYLQRILREQFTVLDFGGNVGVHYLRYRKYLNLQEVRWIVCDVPEITKAARETCAGISNIEFVNDVDEVKVSRLDILLASDSIQYIDAELPGFLLQKLVSKGVQPEHILIDQLPLYHGERFVTLQNGGLVCYPQHVFNHEQFIKTIEGFSYELIDIWTDNVDSCVVPFHPEKSLSDYKGLYFLRKPL
jgi:putative methyltransferase (TIGR04325 family)